MIHYLCTFQSCSPIIPLWRPCEDQIQPRAQQLIGGSCNFVCNTSFNLKRNYNYNSYFYQSFHQCCLIWDSLVRIRIDRYYTNSSRAFRLMSTRVRLMNTPCLHLKSFCATGNSPFFIEPVLFTRERRWSLFCVRLIQSAPFYPFSLISTQYYCLIYVQVLQIVSFLPFFRPRLCTYFSSPCAKMLHVRGSSTK